MTRYKRMHLAARLNCQLGLRQLRSCPVPPSNNSSLQNATPVIMEGRRGKMFYDLNLEQLIKMLMEVSGSQFWDKSSEGNQIRGREVCELN